MKIAQLDGPAWQFSQGLLDLLVQKPRGLVPSRQHLEMSGTWWGYHG